MSTPSERSSRSPAKGRRIAEKPPKERRLAGRLPRTGSPRGAPQSSEPVRGGAQTERTSDRKADVPAADPATSGTGQGRRVPVLAGAVLVLVAGLAALGTAVAGVGPEWIDGAGAIAIATVLTGALAHRTGGRPVVATALALGLGLAAVLLGGPVLQTGAAILTVVVGGVYAVMATVPATTYLRAAREVLFASVVVMVASLAAVGFEPTVTQPRFDYASVLLSLALVFGIVYRLGAGIHGLGRRGLIAVLAGVVVLVLTLAYAELLRQYGAVSVVGSAVDFAEWTTERIGAFPRPLVVLLGIPALLWGCFQRARRRQGWWVCAFGVTATVPLAQGLLDPDGSYLEAALRAAYSLVLGLLVGYLIVRLDLALTAPRGRRGRRAEEAQAHRPEPSRFAEL